MLQFSNFNRVMEVDTISKNVLSSKNKMSRIILSILLVALLMASNTQAQITFGARVGFNLTNLYQKDEQGDMKGLDWKPGFQIGAVVDYPLLNDLSIQPGILFATQGAKTETKVSGHKAKATINLHYIQVPINLQYKYDLNYIKLFAQAGPYIGYGIGGKLKTEISEGKTSVSNSSKIKFGRGDDADFNAFDFGFGLGAGLQFGNIQAVFGYNQGLVNLDTDVNAKNLGLCLTVTYLFRK